MAVKLAAILMTEVWQLHRRLKVHVLIANTCYYLVTLSPFKTNEINFRIFVSTLVSTANLETSCVENFRSRKIFPCEAHIVQCTVHAGNFIWNSCVRTHSLFSLKRAFVTHRNCHYGQRRTHSKWYVCSETSQNISLAWMTRLVCVRQVQSTLKRRIVRSTRSRLVSTVERYTLCSTLEIFFFSFFFLNIFQCGVSLAVCVRKERKEIWCWAAKQTNSAILGEKKTHDVKFRSNGTSNKFYVQQHTFRTAIKEKCIERFVEKMNKTRKT